MPKWSKEKHPALLRKARASQEFTQAQLAERLGYANGSIVSQWENQVAEPGDEIFDKLVTIFGGDAFSDDASTLQEISNLGDYVRRKRINLGLTIAQVAAQIGVSYAAIWNIECGNTLSPQKRTLKGLEEVFQEKLPIKIAEEVKQEAEIEVKGVGEFLQFDPHDEKNLPETSGVYVFYDVSERPIYIGISKNIRSRIKNSHWDKFWYRPPIVQTAAYIEVKEQELRRQLEKTMIKFLRRHAVINKQDVDRGEQDDD